MNEPYQQKELMRSRLIEKQAVAELLGITVNTLYAWIHQKRIPYVKIGRLVKFDQADIDAWIAQRKVKVRNLD